MQKEKTVLTVLAASFIILLTASFISAGFWQTITGKVSSQPTNVSIQVVGAHQCRVDYVAPIANTDPMELSSKTITFEVHVYDPDGMNDINQTTTFANFSKSGQTTRVSPMCTYMGNLPPNGANFTCTIDMWYWDGGGSWDINVVGNDFGNLTQCTNSSTAFTYTLLSAMVITPQALTWPALPTGSTNRLSNNHPTVINNTGNYNGAVSMTGLDLYGDADSAAVMGVNNFTTNNNVGTVCTSGTVLVNGTLTAITGTNSNPGNLSLDDGSGQSDLYYCIPTVPSIESQTYSTNTAGSWTVSY